MSYGINKNYTSVKIMLNPWLLLPRFEQKLNNKILLSLTEKMNLLLSLNITAIREQLKVKCPWQSN